MEVNPDLLKEYAATLKGLAESPCPLVLHDADGRALTEAGLVERVAHVRWTGTTYRLTAAGLQAALSLSGKVHPVHVPMSTVAAELGDPATWAADDAAYEEEIRRRR